MIRKEVFVSTVVLEQLRDIVEDSQVWQKTWYPTVHACVRVFIDYQGSGYRVA